MQLYPPVDYLIVFIDCCSNQKKKKAKFSIVYKTFLVLKWIVLYS